MLATVALALLGVSAAYSDTTELLLRKDVRDNYDVHKVCRVARLQKWYQTEDALTPFRKLDSEKTKWKVDRCCNKLSTFDKKQCLRNVREQLLDTHCENRLTHVCCQTPGALRSFCVVKNPFTSLARTNLNRLETLDHTLNRFGNWETDNEYTRWGNAEDVLHEESTNEVDWLREKLYRPLWNTEEVYGQTVLDLEDDKLDAVVPYPFGRRKCDNSNHCRRQLEKATRVAAKQTCLKNTLSVKAGQETTQTCCQAGALVGATVGKRHKNVCLPAVYKFQSKTQGCCVNHKPGCKDAFVACCKQAKADRESVVAKYNLENELRTNLFENVADEVASFHAYY